MFPASRHCTSHTALSALNILLPVSIPIPSPWKTYSLWSSSNMSSSGNFPWHLYQESWLHPSFLFHHYTSTQYCPSAHHTMWSHFTSPSSLFYDCLEDRKWVLFIFASPVPGMSLMLNKSLVNELVNETTIHNNICYIGNLKRGKTYHPRSLEQ